MVVIDAQVHVWGRNTQERPWLLDGEHGAKAHTDKGILLKDTWQEFTAEQLVTAMDEAGVDGAVLVPPNFEGDRNDLVLAAARDHAPRFAVMGRIDADDQDGTLATMRSWKDNVGAFGFRLSPTRGKPVDESLDQTPDWFWQTAQELGIRLMVKAHAHGRLDPLVRIARQYPELRFAVDAFGLREHDRDAEAVSGVGKLCALAEIPNISVKATSAPSYTTEAYPFPTMQQVIRTVVEAFGAERVFWGTDISRLPCTYREAVDLVAQECDFLSQEQRELVLGRAIVSWLGWER